MLTAVVTVTGTNVEVSFTASSEEEGEEEHAAAEGEEHAEGEGTHEPTPTETGDDLNPIFPEVKEVVWGFGAFIVLALLMRFFLYPRLRKGMDARYNNIRGDHEAAEALTDAARKDVAEYEQQLTAVKAEAQARVEAARQQLETERQERLAEVNRRINERRTAAMAEVEAARAAASGEVESAVAQVAARASELATGRAPDPAVVNEVVANTVREGVGS